MRLAFCGNPMVGHLMPMFPLMRAAVHAGHTVALITGSAMEAFTLEHCSPRVSVLSAGPSSQETMASMLVRTGANPATRPQLDTIAAYFAGEQVRAAFPEAIVKARSWRPDVIVSETMDFVGAAVAGALNVPLVRHTYGPTRPRRLTSALTRTAVDVAAQLGTPSATPRVWVDAFPEFLQRDDLPAPSPRIAIRPQVRRSPVGQGEPFGGRPAGQPVVLVTTGTVFTDPEIQDRLVDAVRGSDRHVVLATGQMGGEPAVNGSADGVTRSNFRAMGDLLRHADVVVTAGGAGTVLAAFITGVPMAVMPLGADHARNAAAAEAAGTALLARTFDAVGDAVTRILSEKTFESRARSIAESIARLPDPKTALENLLRSLGE